MNDEIKEILDEPKILQLSYGCYISLNDYFKLRDYITNLQQENEGWAMIFDTFSKRPYAHKYLEEKRKELGNDKIIGLDSEMIYKDYYDYKSRIDKAVEYIKEHPTDMWYSVEKPNEDFREVKIIKHQEVLLNILQGENDE